MARMLRVEVTRTFQSHSAKDVLLVEENEEVEKLIAARLFSIVAIEDPGTPAVVVEETPPVPKAKKKPAAKKRAAKDV